MPQCITDAALDERGVGQPDAPHVLVKTHGGLAGWGRSAWVAAHVLLRAAVNATACIGAVAWLIHSSHPMQLAAGWSKHWDVSRADHIFVTHRDLAQV